MLQLTEATPQPTRRRSRSVLPAIVIAAAAILVALYFRRPAPAAVSTLHRAQLTLKDGRLFRTGSELPFTGLMIETNALGGLLSRSSVSNGLLEGASEGFYTNGQIQVLEFFRGSISHGTRTKWHPNGVKASEGHISMGKVEGVFVRWAEDGTVAEEITMKSNEPSGPSRAYYPSGFIKAEARLENGKAIEQKFHSDGEHRLPTLSPNSTNVASPATP